MIKISAIILSIVLSLFLILSCGGGGSSSNNSSDNSDVTEIDAEKFTPPTGSCTSTDPDSPCPRRLLLATSTDGKVFERLNIVLSDQANTPNILQLSSGRILIYYTGSNLDLSIPGSQRDGIAAAVSDDDGENWDYYKIKFTGFDDGPPIVDPDIILMEDGTFRMYVTRGITVGGSTKVGVLWADSDDGFNFTYGGIAAVRDDNIVDSLTYKIGSTYHMYVLNPISSGSFSYFTSTDGESFTYVSEAEHKIDSETYILSNWFKESSGEYRVFAFSFINEDIRSFTTTDGATLSAGSDVHLSFSDDNSALEKTWIKDAAVLKLKSGSYLMAYVAEIP